MKPVYDAVLFDFDGTLTESHRGILASAYETLDAMGVEAPPEAVMHRMIGPPLWFTFTELCHMPPEQAEEAIERFRVKYDSWGVYQNQLYPHVEEMLEELKQAGVALCAATSKSPVAAGNVFSFFHLERWLSYLSTPDGEEKSSNKKELILKALNHLGVPCCMDMAPGRKWNRPAQTVLQPVSQNWRIYFWAWKKTRSDREFTIYLWTNTGDKSIIFCMSNLIEK